jgi:hypothetical protein
METTRVKERRMWQLQLQANRLVEANPSLPAAAVQRELSQGKPQQKEPGSVSQPGNHRLVLRLVEQSRARDLFLLPAKLKEMQHQLEEDSPVPRARARRYSRCPGPCAFSPETPGARKCNREARCGDYPILARYRLLRTRDALADCDNKRSRSQRKRVRRAGTFPIAAADRYRCLPRRTAD